MSIEWVKISTNMFNSRKIKQIETLINGDTILVIWCKLLCLAGIINDFGKIYITDKIPYDNDSLSVELNRPTVIVSDALSALRSMGMIEDCDGGLKITNWEEYQNTEKLGIIREQNRLRKQRQREREQEEKERKEQTDQKKEKHKYGSLKNVLLTDEEFTKLQNRFEDIDERIERLSLYISSSGKSYKSHYATILSWAKKDEETANDPKNIYYQEAAKSMREKNRRSFYANGRDTDYDAMFGGVT